MTDYTKLIERLRTWKAPSFIPVEGHPMLEAADAIEALQAENERLHLENRGATQERDAIYDLIESRRKHMEELRGALVYHMEQTRPIQRSIDAIAALAAPKALEPLTRKQIDDLAEEGVFLGNIYEITKEIEAAHGITKGTP